MTKSMHQALASTLSLSLYLLALIPSITSASILLLPPSSNTTTTTPLTLHPPTNLTIPEGQIRCIVRYPHPLAPIDLPTCQPTIDRLLSYPWTNTRRTYTFPPSRPEEVQSIQISDGDCAISLGRRAPMGSIAISLREIVTSVIRVLTVCRGFGEGGLQVVDPPWWKWIVVVEGGVREMGALVEGRSSQDAQ